MTIKQVPGQAAGAAVNFAQPAHEGQTRVLVLLIVLFLLEMVIHPGIKEWVRSVASQVNSALGGAPPQQAKKQ